MDIPVSGGPLRVLDSNLDKNNIVPTDLYRKILDNTCDQLIQIFSTHCGPLSSYAVIDDKFTSPDKPSFSKDGIDILNSISFVNEVQDGIRRLLAYCASNSDKTVGDGTTSAIIISIKALQSCLQSPSISKAPFYKLRKAYNYFLKTYLESETGTFHVEDFIKDLCEKYPNIPADEIEQKVVEHVAYSQAYISSHGDAELAEAVAKLFSHTPRDAWEHITYRRSIFEKENERFTFEYSTDQFVTTARVMNPSMLNRKIGGKLKFTNATLIPLPHPILVSQREHFTKLCDIIVDHIDNKKELLIIHTNVLDSQTTQTLNDLIENSRLEGHPNETVAILRHDALTDDINDITVLNLIAGKIPNFASEPFNVIEGVTVDFDQFQVKINNLYDNPENSLEHPFFGDPDYTYLTDVIGTIRETMDNYKNSGPTYSKRDDMKNFHDLYMKLKYTRRAVVTIGGLTHDSLTSVPVLEDALYATRSSLLEGFEKAAACGMYSKCSNLYTKSNSITSDPDIDRDVVSLMFEFGVIFMNAVEVLQKIIYTDFQNDTIKTNNHHSPVDIYSGKLKDSTFMSILLDELIVNPLINGSTFKNDDGVFLIQPKNINKTILKRFGDLFLRLLNVDKFVVLGGVTLDGSTEEGK